MILIPLLCVISSLHGIFANPMSAFDQSILKLLKMKPEQFGNKKFGQPFSILGDGAAPGMRPWNLQGIEMGKPMISRPFQAGVNPAMTTRFIMPQTVYNPNQSIKMHQEPFAPYADQKATQQFQPQQFQQYTSEPQKTHENPSFPDPRNIAMNAFPGDINTAALHAMNLRNPTMPSFDIKSFMRDQSPDHQRKLQQQMRDFGTNPEFTSAKKPETFEGVDVNESFKKFNRGPSENQGFAQGQDFGSFFPGRE